MTLRAGRSSLLLSTHNAHKLREFNRLLEPAGITVVPLPDDVVLPPEDGDTFADNALPKARAAAAAAGRAAIADDSGIEAAALDGRPGVRSARFAGPEAPDQENLDKLMRAAPAGSRCATCALAYATRERRRARGLVHRHLAAEARPRGLAMTRPSFPTQTMADAHGRARR